VSAVGLGDHHTSTDRAPGIISPPVDTGSSGGLVSTGQRNAHQGHPVWHEHPDPSRLRRDGDHSDAQPHGEAGNALRIGLMTAGTALVFAGLYVGGGLW
jgi:hypothetical protein